MIERESGENGTPKTPPEQGLKFVLEEMPSNRVSTKVIGVGGCGGNIVDYMIEQGLGGVDYISLNTDEQALKRCNAPVKLQIGNRVTQGYGTGSNPEVGREAALENTEELTELLGEADMVFIAAGLGGGTGTGAAPVVGSLAKQMGALTIAVAVKPFAFEGKRRSRVADEGFESLLEQVDTAIEIPNERLLAQIEAGSGFFESFRVANHIATETLQGITDIITRPGVMNSDFADIREVLQEAGVAMVGSAERDGRDAAAQAARDAIDGLMVDNGGLKKARKVLINITGSSQFGMHDASEALQYIQNEFDEEAEIIIGTVKDDQLSEQVRVMVVASGFRQDKFRLHSRKPVEDSQGPFSRSDSYWPTDDTAEPAAMEEVGEPEPPGQDPALPVPLAAEAELQPGQADEADQEHSHGSELPSTGSPLEFVPPPTISTGREEEPPRTRRKSAFFRRHSIFR